MKILVWASALAVLGGCVAAKSAEIHVLNIIIGVALGAFVGSLIGYSLIRVDLRKAQR